MSMTEHNRRLRLPREKSSTSGSQSRSDDGAVRFDLWMTLETVLLSSKWHSILRKGPDMLEAWILFSSSSDEGSCHSVAPAVGALPSTGRLTAHMTTTSMYWKDVIELLVQGSTWQYSS